MPIRPENKSRYPENWNSEIRPAILKRADNNCENCGVKNHSIVWRSNFNDEWFYENDLPSDRDVKLYRKIKIILTIAHLDHTPENCHPENLRAWCQKCHNCYDQPKRIENRRNRLMIQSHSNKVPCK